MGALIVAPRRAWGRRGVPAPAAGSTRALVARAMQHLVGMTGLPAFDTTVEKTNEWLNELSAQLHVPSRQDAYAGLRATLHALRDQLPLELAVGLAAQLPMLLRGLYFEGWRPAQIPARIRHLQGFLDVVAHQLNPNLKPRVQDIVHESFDVLQRHITAGEANKIRDALPAHLRVLWPEPS